MARIVVAALEGDVTVKVNGVDVKLEARQAREFSFSSELRITAGAANAAGKSVKPDPNVSDPIAGTGAFKQSSGD